MYNFSFSCGDDTFTVFSGGIGYLPWVPNCCFQAARNFVYAVSSLKENGRPVTASPPLLLKWKRGGAENALKRRTPRRNVTNGSDGRAIECLLSPSSRCACFQVPYHYVSLPVFCCHRRA